MLRHIPVKCLTTQAQTKVLSLGTSHCKDFFGIRDITSKDIAGAFKSLTKLPPDELEEKYGILYEPRYIPENEERRENVVYGQIRKDSDNVPKSHGQYEPSNVRPKVDTIQVKQKFMPDEKHGTMLVGISHQLEESDPQYEPSNIALGNPPYKISEVEPVEPISTALNLLKTERAALVIASDYKNCAPLRFFFESDQKARQSLDSDQSFATPTGDIRAPKIDRKRPPEPINPSFNDATITTPITPAPIVSTTATATSANSNKLSGRKIDPEDLDEAITEALMMNDNKYKLTYDPKFEPTPLHELEPGSEEYMERFNEKERPDEFDHTLDLKYSVKPAAKQKASDYLKQVRSKMIEPTAKGLKHRLEKSEVHYPLDPTLKLDSKGYNNYAHQVPNWSACRHEQILEYIKKSIIYNNYDILAINKPYGIASHEEDKKKERLDMNSLVLELAKELRLESVHLTHRLDKNSTGVLLFATSAERARKLHKLFRSDQIKKTYWCITSRIPEPMEGIIDIPIGEYKCAGKLRSCPVFEFGDEMKQLSRRYRESKRAITEYRVLKTSHQAALVEVKPRSGVKHQIRCHLGFAINTPILGDHKYSHLDRIAPQRLSVPILNMLHLRQEKVRTLPIHLHAKRIVIPNAKGNNETLFIDAPLPAHFAHNLKALKLKVDTLEG